MTELRWKGACWLRGRGPCEGWYEWHHLIRQQLIRKHSGRWVIATGLGKLLADPRNLADTCNRHHQLVTSGALQIARFDLPYSVEDFAHAYGFEQILDREYGARDDLAAAIAARTGYRRRAVETWLAAGRVRIDGERIPWGAKVPPDGLGRVKLNGMPL